MSSVTINGADLYYEEHGTGEPLLLIHGTGANTRIWGRTVDDLAETHRVIAYDRRGFGRSGGPLARRLSEHADDAAELIAQLDARPADVVAWSGGGVIALALAIEHPEAVASLVLEEAALHGLRNPSVGSLRMTVAFQFDRFIRRDRRAAARTMFRWANRYTSGGSSFDKFPGEWQESMVASANATVAEIDQLVRLYPKAGGIAAIRNPVTVVEAGLSDPTFHRSNRHLRKLIPTARFVEIEGASHAIHFDCPEEFAAVVRGAERPAIAVG